MEIKQFLLSDKSTLILTMDEDMSIDDGRALGEIYQKAFPNTQIILNYPSLVKEITIVDRPMEMKPFEVGDDWFEKAVIT